jgi:hypothetical protein
MAIINTYYHNFVAGFTDQYSFLLDGVNEKLITNNDYVFNVNKKLSLSCRVNLQALGIFQTFISNRYYDGKYNGFQLGITNTNYFYLILFDDSANGTETLRVDYQVVSTTDNWYQFGATYDGSNDANGIKLYVNGSQVVGTINHNSARPGIDRIAPINIGAHNQDTAYLNGYIDEVSLWDNVELTATQMNTIWNNGCPGDITNLNPTSWWRADNAKWDRTKWVVKDAMYNFDMISVNMDIDDKTTIIPC